MSSSAIATPQFQAKASSVQNADGTSLAQKVVTGMVVTDSPMMFRNRIINGNFDIWQRGTSGVNVPNAQAGGYGSADRWKFIGHESGVSYASVSLTQSTDVPTGSRYSAKLVSPSAGLDDVAIAQIIEAANTYDLVGKQVTLSLYMKRLGALTGQTIGIEISYLNTLDTGPTVLHDVPMGSVTTVASQNILAANFSNSWTKYTLTTSVLPAQAANGLCVRIYIDGVNIGSGDLFAIAQVQLETGTIATPFEQRNIGTELNLCQRYFEVVASSTEGYSLFPGAIDFARNTFPLQVTKRATPTISAPATAGAEGGGSWTPSYSATTRYWALSGYFGGANLIRPSVSGPITVSAEL